MSRFFFSMLFFLATFFAKGQLLQDLSLKYLIKLPSAQVLHAPVIILLHGYGSNEADLFELKALFPEKYIIISVRAPFAVNEHGFQWFALGRENEKEIQYSRHLIAEFITEISARYQIDARNIYLVGFSQGAMMCYDVGLSYPDKIRGIASLSGRLFANLKEESRNTSVGLRLLRVFIAHGMSDERIPFSEAKTANEYLKRIGLKPELHKYPGLGHSISNEELKELIHWMQ